MSKIAQLPLKVFSQTHLSFATTLKKGKPQALVFILGEWSEAAIHELIGENATAWQAEGLDQKMKEVMHFSGRNGPVWILAKKNSSENKTSHFGFGEESEHAWYRDQAGSLLSQFRSYDLKEVEMKLMSTSVEQERAVILGLNMAAYHYKTAAFKEPFKDCAKIHISKKIDSQLLQEIEATSLAVNCARHLVNLPPNLLNPQSLSEMTKKYFTAKSGVKVAVWNKAKLEKEKMGLLLGVGQGSPTQPCLVHIAYRPAKSRLQKPIAIVGKGITFDSGGLDIKPSSGMRLMKKDMGGAAATLALAMWAQASKYSRPLDFYLALAENSVDGLSMRPSDVLVARNGLQVEIHNTDAEGRLVLADALDVAVTRKGKDEPEMVLNFATLTGACKVALGSDIAGLFCNDDELAEEIHSAGIATGDLNWRLPLFQKYTAGFNSNFADLVNATDGFGGAITAALFLEKFVRQKPWVHLDIYAWNDKAQGGLTFAGGNGQPVQAVVEFLKNKA